MDSQTEACSLHRARPATVIVVFAVAAGIALANLSSEPVTSELIKRSASKPERAYGWPVSWYWREASIVPGRIPPRNGRPVRPLLEWPVTRYSASGLIANLAIWLMLLAASAAACQRLLGKYQLRASWRPRLTTLMISLLIVAPMVLANMTFVLGYALPYAQLGMASYGWPFVWHWYWVAPFDNVYGWDFSAARLAGDIAVWLGTCFLVALPCEWLLRRFRPRLRFSLRTMLAAVAVVAVLCAWCVAIWKRADEQDALAASRLISSQLWVERPGPQWLRLVLPDRFRRRVVGASIYVASGVWSDDEDQEVSDDDGKQMQDGGEWDTETGEEASDADDEIDDDVEDREDEEILRRLGRLSALRFLKIDCGVLTPAMTDALAEMRQLRSLHVALPVANWRGRSTNFAWVGHLRQLEQLSLEGVASDELGCLANLTRLKSLTLDLTDCKDDDSEMDKRLAAVGKLTQLHRVYLKGSPGAQIAHLGGLRNLKVLALDYHHFHRDGKRLRQCFAALGTLRQVEVLRLATPTGPLKVCADNLASLRGMKNLKSLSLLITCDKAERQSCLAAIANLTQLRRLWLQGDLVVTGLAELAPLESLEELLISDPGMETPAAIESLSALKGLNAVYIPTLAFDFSKSDEGANARRALKSFQRSHPGRVSNLRLEWQNEIIPWGAGQHFADDVPDFNSSLQHFDDKPPDLNAFLGGNPAAF